MAVGDEYVFPSFLTPVQIQFSFQGHLLLFSHVLAEVRGKNTPERKFISTGYQIHKHQVISPTRSPLSYTGGANFVDKAICVTIIYLIKDQQFSNLVLVENWC